MYIDLQVQVMPSTSRESVKLMGIQFSLNKDILYTE